MYKSNLHYWLIALVIFSVLSACSKDKVLEISHEKMPITTTASEAASAYQLGMTATDKLQNVKAAKYFNQALEQDPSFAMCWLQMGFVLPGTDLMLAALDSAKFYAPGASRGEQLIIQAAAFGVEGKKQEQHRALESLVELYPGDERVQLAMGNYHFELQQYRQAIDSYDKATTINPNLAILFNQIGYSQRALGNYGEAEKAFKRYIRLNSDNANAFDSYAELLMEMGRYKEAVDFYGQALEKDPNFVASYLGMACSYGFMGQHDQARDQLDIMKSGVRNHVDLRRAIYAEALTYVCENNLSQAITIFQDLMEMKDNDSEMANRANDLAAIGSLFLELDSTEAALSRFEQSIQLVRDSDLPPAIIEVTEAQHLYNLARVYAAQGDFEKAKQMAREYLVQIEPLNNPLRMQLSFQLKGIIALHEKDYEEAIIQLEQANQLNPYNLYRIGLAYEGMGEKDRAVMMMQRAEELNVLNSMDQALVLSKTRHKITS